jgi:predicted nucleotidyltransferase
MANLKNSEKIRPELVPILSALTDDASRAAAAAGRSLVAAALFGSATGPRYRPGKSDVNVFLVFDQVDMALLKALLPVFNRHLKKLRSRPVVVDSEFMFDASDTFPMEFLEWKESSISFFGTSPLDAADISRQNLRLEIEENLRGKRLRLVQSYFEVGGNAARFLEFLESTLPNFLTVFRNVLRLAGDAPEYEPEKLMKAIELRTGIDLTGFRRLIQSKACMMKITAGELDTVFHAYLEELDKITEYIDSFDASK